MALYEPEIRDGRAGLEHGAFTRSFAPGRFPLGGVMLVLLVVSQFAWLAAIGYALYAFVV